MRLDAWLSLTGMKQAEFARRINSTPATVHRIVSGTQNIPLSLQDRIFRETEGAVTADDLHAVFAEAQKAGAA